MKLIYRILIHLSLALPIILAAWGILFYMAIIDEVNDEVDDSLEDYSEVLITRALAGEQLPSQSDGSNNSYYLITVTADYAEKQKRIRYSDEMVHIEAKGETEPARVLRTIFKGDAMLRGCDSVFRFRDFAGRGFPLSAYRSPLFRSGTGAVSGSHYSGPSGVFCYPGRW